MAWILCPFECAQLYRCSRRESCGRSPERASSSQSSYVASADAVKCDANEAASKSSTRTSRHVVLPAQSERTSVTKSWCRIRREIGRCLPETACVKLQCTRLATPRTPPQLSTGCKSRMALRPGSQTTISTARSAQAPPATVTTGGSLESSDWMALYARACSCSEW